MVHEERYTTVIASYPEFDNLVAEVNFENNLVIVISKEPNEDEFFVSFFEDAVGAKCSSMSTPSDTERTRLKYVIEAMNEAKAELQGN